MYFETWFKADLRHAPQLQTLHGLTFTGDDKGSRVGVIVTDDGEAATLNGAVLGYAIRPDGNTVVLTGAQHKNPVAALAGRSIVCGSPSYLYFHGIDYNQQLYDEQQMLEAPGDSLALLDQYGVDYVYISSYERMAFEVDEAWFVDNCDTVFAEGNVCLYRRRGVHWKSTET